MATSTNLQGCYIQNHSSVEFGGDQVNLSTLPSHIVIEIRGLSGPAPDDLLPGQSTQGFWYVRSENFSISNSTAFNIVNPCGNYVIDGADVGPTPGATGTAMNSNSIIQVGITQQGDVSQLNRGKYFSISDMTPTENGVANWDDNVADVMFTDSIKQSALDPSNPMNWTLLDSNLVLCYVRLKDNFIMPGVDKTIRVDISGYREWQSYVG